MKRQLLTSQGTWDKGVLIVRVMTGFIILKYGLELFDNDKIIGYTQWLTDTNFPMPKIMTYVGKTTELIGGLLLILGLFARIVSIPLIINMIVVTFYLGEGKILTADQHPFLFILLFLIFLSVGGGKWSLDYLIFNRAKQK